MNCIYEVHVLESYMQLQMFCQAVKGKFRLSLSFDGTTDVLQMFCQAVEGKFRLSLSFDGTTDTAVAKGNRH